MGPGSADVSGQIWTHEKDENGNIKANGKGLHCPDRTLITPCTDEIKRYLLEKDERYKQPAYDCFKTVYETKQEDFWVMKNMTHLLLDLDTSDHNFDHDRENDFYQLGLDFGMKLMQHPKCLEEFDTKSALQCRCPMLYGKILILKLKNADRWDEAQKFFDDLKQQEYFGAKKRFLKGEMFPWTDITQTPQIFIPGLKTEPIWPEARNKDLPIVQVLEDNYPVIKEEVVKAFSTDYVDDAYRFLYKGGKWNQIVLFHGRNYTEACEKGLPETCKVLREALPKRDVHWYPWTSNQNEQIVLLKMTPGTDVESHCGPANNILNIHLGITGTEGAELIVAGEKTGWQDGKVISWDGSYDHSINCHKCKKDRIILMVRYMHPDVKPDDYKHSDQTHFEPIPKNWIEAWAKGESANALKGALDPTNPWKPSDEQIYA